MCIFLYNGGMLSKLQRSLKSTRAAFIVLSLMLFFLSIQVSLTIYIDSSFLKSTISHSSLSKTFLWENPDNMVGVVYTLASLLTILALLYSPVALRRYGNYRWSLSILILHTIILLSLASSTSAWLILPFFITSSALLSVLYFNFDIFLERYSVDEETGRIRGLFMTIASVAWLLPPMFAGNLVEHHGFQSVYFIGAIILFPVIFLMIRYLSDFKDLAYEDSPLFLPKDTNKKHPGIISALWMNFFLQFFYAWIVIYSPIYFHENLAVSYGDFGLMLSIALIAFVLIPLPVGWLADKILGEKELFIVGFLVMGISVVLFPILAKGTFVFWHWALLLFVGRIGASCVETMSETYFFKQIDGSAAGYIGHFRRMRPIAYIIAPMTASSLLSAGIITLPELFPILGGVMLLAAGTALTLKDTK